LLSVTAVVAIGVLVAVSRAGAWGPPRWVSADGWLGTDSIAIAIDRQGDALLVWQGCDLATPGCYDQLQARTWSRRARLGPIVDVTQPGPATAWQQVASDDDGDAVVAWQQHDTHTNWRVAARRVGRRGALGPIQLLSPEGVIGTQARVAVAPGGRALVVWSEYRPSTSSGTWYTVARQLFKNGSLGPALELGTGSAEAPAVAMDRRGAAVVAWTDSTRVIARRITASRVSPVRVVATGGAPTGGFALVHATSGRDGDFVISFRSAVHERPRVWLRTWRRGGSLGRPLAVSPRRQWAGFHHALATDRDGDTVVVWTRELPPNRIVVYARTVPRTAVLGRVVRLGAGDHPDAALDDHGHGSTVWQPLGVDPAPVRARTIGARGFGRLQTIGRDGRVPQVAVSPRGRTVAIWQQHAAPYRIQTASGVAR
jgi:hypothetical protein